MEGSASGSAAAGRRRAPPGEGDADGEVAGESARIVQPIPTALDRPAGSAVNPPSRADTGPLNVCYDLALKQHEQMDRNFATLDDKTKIVFGVTSFLVIGQAQLLARLDGILWLQGVLGAVWLALFGGMTYHCWRAYWLQTISQLPNSAAIYREMSAAPEATARKQIIAELDKAIADNKSAYAKRARHFKRAAGFMLAAVSTLVAAALASPFFKFLDH